MIEKALQKMTFKITKKKQNQQPQPQQQQQQQQNLKKMYTGTVITRHNLTNSNYLARLKNR